MKRQMSIGIRGKTKHWTFEINEDPKYLQEWWNDGLDITITENTIPEFIVDIGLARVWCFFQDVFNFRKPW